MVQGVNGNYPNQPTKHTHLGVGGPTPQVQLEDYSNAAQAALAAYNADPSNPNNCAALMKAINALYAFVNSNQTLPGAANILASLQASTGAGGLSLYSLAADYGTANEAAALKDLESAAPGTWGDPSNPNNTGPNASNLYSNLYAIDNDTSDSSNQADQRALLALESALQLYQADPSATNAALVAAAMQSVNTELTTTGASDGFLTIIQLYMSACPTGSKTDLLTLSQGNVAAFQAALKNGGLQALLSLVQTAQSKEGWPS